VHADPSCYLDPFACEFSFPLHKIIVLCFEPGPQFGIGDSPERIFVTHFSGLLNNLSANFPRHLVWG